MSEALTLLLAWVAGAALGVVFFGGLWWTVRRGVTARQPALWFFASLLLRMAIVLSGFYLVSGGQWQRLLACLLGFVIARFLLVRMVGLPLRQNALRAKEAGHAP